MKRHLAMGLSALCFAIVGPTVKLIGSSVPIMTIVFLRLFIALVFLAVTLPRLDKNTFKVCKKDLPGYFLVGFLLALTLTTFIAANIYTHVQNAVLLSRASPFFVLIVAGIFLKEKITRKKLIALVIAFTGLMILNPFQSGDYLFGNSLALLNAVFAAFMITAMRKEDESHSIGNVFWFFLFATIIMLPFPLIFGFGDIAGAWPFILLLGIVGTGISYLLSNYALEEIEAEESSIVSTVITPIGAILIATAMLGETLLPQTLWGGSILVLSGIYLEARRAHVKKMEAVVENGLKEIGEEVMEIEEILSLKKQVKGTKKKSD